MATNNNPPKKRAGKAKRFNDVKWINWSLTKEQKAEIKAWTPDFEEMDDLEIKIIQQDHKVTTSYDNYGDCYTTSIVPTQDNSTNEGYILTGKGSTPHKSRKQAFYIHLQIFNSDWSTYSTGGSKEELDD